MIVRSLLIVATSKFARDTASAMFDYKPKKWYRVAQTHRLTQIQVSFRRRAINHRALCGKKPIKIYLVLSSTRNTVSAVW